MVRDAGEIRIASEVVADLSNEGWSLTARRGGRRELKHERQDAHSEHFGVDTRHMHIKCRFIQEPGEGSDMFQELLRDA
jgi:hypothetical protein